MKFRQDSSLFTFSWQLNMSCSRFRSAKSAEEERALLAEVTPKATQYNTKWALKVFRDWQGSRSNKNVEFEEDASGRVDMSKVQDLTCTIEEMSPESLNFWLSKFVGEVAKQNGERYPAKTLYLLVCGINRYLTDVHGEKSFNILAKGERRFMSFRKSLDGEMKNATKCGITLMSKKDSREEISEEEEAVLWEKGLLGCRTAESLLYTLYFYNGKLFALRACEHRLLRLCNICLGENYIIFDESLSKTFHGGLNDLKNKPRYIKHLCHDVGETHEPCLVSMYSTYLSKVRDYAKLIDAFYFRPHRSGTFEYEKSPVGLCTLSKILPDKLCLKAGLPRKSAHCLRITCASRLFQNSVEEKLTRERTGHKSNALFNYQKASENQLDNVSDVLAPCVDSRNSRCRNTRPSMVAIDQVPSNTEEEDVCAKGKDKFENCNDLCSLLPKCDSDVFSEFEDLIDVSDEVLGSMLMPESSEKRVENICTNSVFNNCTFNFVVNK